MKAFIASFTEEIKKLLEDRRYELAGKEVEVVVRIDKANVVKVKLPKEGQVTIDDCEPVVLPGLEKDHN